MFPLSTKKGSDCSSINHQKIRMMAEYGLTLNKDHIIKILEAHHEFLISGGAGGQWKALQVEDLVIGFYDSSNTGKGEQAIFERTNLTKTSFNKLALPFANFCGVFARETDFSFSDLSHSLYTDATLEGANFEGANLKKVDFSRSNLKEARFVNANLSGVDFENCDLSNADFTGAKFDTARFPGVNLKGIKY